jgi:hypothetical protein
LIYYNNQLTPRHRPQCSHADVNACNQYGETPLFYGIRRNAPSIVRTLLWYGADKEFVGPSGTPIEVATQMGLPHIVALIEGAPTLPPSSSDYPNSDDAGFYDASTEGASEQTRVTVDGDGDADEGLRMLSTLEQRRERRGGWGAWRELARKAVGSTGLGSLRREKARGVWKVYITSLTGKYLTARADGRVSLSRRCLTKEVRARVR